MSRLGRCPVCDVVVVQVALYLTIRDKLVVQHSLPIMMCDMCYACGSGSSPGEDRPLLDSEGQPGGTAPSFHSTGPQARVGFVQRVCADHQELHPHRHRHQA